MEEQKTDRSATIGFILIGIVLVVWMWVQAPPPPASPLPGSDTTAAAVAPPSAPAETVEEPEPEPGRTRPDSLGSLFGHLAAGEEKILTIETDLYTAELTTRGGMLRKWHLAGFRTWDGHPVAMVDYVRGGDLGLLFTSADGRLVNTRGLMFRSDYAPWSRVRLAEGETRTIEFTLPVAADRSIVRRLTFTGGRYSVYSRVEFRNCGPLIANFEYQLTWDTGLRPAEHNSIDEAGFAKAFAFAGGELAEVDATDPAERPERDINGSTQWVAVRNKYFAVAMIPDSGTSQGAFVQGRRSQEADQGVREDYALALKMPFRGGPVEAAGATIYLGPLDFDVLRSYGAGLDQMMSLGAAWIIRPISEYVMLPLFSGLRWLIPNFGLVIIVFALIIKIALHPLTKSSMKSMRAMQALQPMLAEIREKHKDDPQKLNQAMMNLYRDYGINPAGGCLPLLLQMPILFALYAVFSSAIELRQASFVGWITDLSIPDTIFTLPFTIPLFGISAISGLALAMGVTMFIQQKQTVTDPRQKALVWMMPVMMTLLFNNFPSGLNLYYFVFNILSIGQQYLVNKKHEGEPLRKVDPKKKGTGLISRIARDLPKMK